MSQPVNNKIDSVIHQQTRLSIMASLSGVDSLNFNELKATCALTDGNLSTHLSHLEKAGYVKITKSFKGKKTLTTICTTPAGKKALSRYIDILQSIINRAK